MSSFFKAVKSELKKIDCLFRYFFLQPNVKQQNSKFYDLMKQTKLFTLLQKKENVCKNSVWWEIIPFSLISVSLSQFHSFLSPFLTFTPPSLSQCMSFFPSFPFWLHSFSVAFRLRITFIFSFFLSPFRFCSLFSLFDSRSICIFCHLIIYL